MRWTVHGERPLYESEWVSLHLADVELPDGHRFEHHVVRLPAPAAGTVVHDPERGVLLLWRHRFIGDRWGWEIPAGRVEAGETPAQGAAREVLEETGWRVTGELEQLVEWSPTAGISDTRFTAFLARGAERVGDPADAFEAERVEWVPVDEVRRLVRSSGIGDGLSLVALTFCLAFAEL